EDRIGGPEGVVRDAGPRVRPAEVSRPLECGEGSPLCVLFFVFRRVTPEKPNAKRRSLAAPQREAGQTFSPARRAPSSRRGDPSAPARPPDSTPKPPSRLLFHGLSPRPAAAAADRVVRASPATRRAG